MPSEENQIGNILRKLNREETPYIIIGGVPTILYGVERPTYDVDIAVPEDLDELSKEVITIPFKDTFMLCPSIQKLIEMKEAVGRPEDMEDVRKLRQILGKLEKKYYE